MKRALQRSGIPLLSSSLFFVLVFAVAVPSIASNTPEGISVVWPAHNSLVEGDFVSIVVRLNKGSFDSVRISRNKSEIVTAPVAAGKDYFCRTIPLEYGPNQITVTAFESGRAGAEKEVTVFYRSDISKEFRISPPEYQRTSFHEAAKEAGCVLCHRMEPSEEDRKPARPENSMCYRCHKKLTEHSNVHGPAARWDCFTCHDKETKPVRYGTRKPERDLCFTCHKEKKEEWKPKKYVHGPTATGKCSICHDPHASENPFWLRKPTWDLCVNCHEDRASGAHVIVGFGSGTHPTKDRPDPLRYGKELTCASCHNPHYSNSKSLFVNDEEDLYNLCKACHKNK